MRPTAVFNDDGGQLGDDQPRYRERNRDRDNESRSREFAVVGNVSVLKLTAAYVSFGRLSILSSVAPRAACLASFNHRHHYIDTTGVRLFPRQSSKPKQKNPFKLSY